MWIAFKNYYLRDTTQLNIFFVFFILSCELLSKIIIFVTRHNKELKGSLKATVVNCFQKLLSSWHDTTKMAFYAAVAPLWIAFKNYYLRDTTQRAVLLPSTELGCELLSKIIIFVTRHNSCFKALCKVWGCELLSKIIIFVTRHNNHWRNIN